MHRLLAPAVALALALPAPAAAAAGALRAERITDATAPALQIGGPDAVGGVGDWYLANDVVEVVVDDPSRRFAALGHGGTIVDAGRLDREDEDQLGRLFPLLNLDQRVLLSPDRIRAEVDPGGGFARLVVSGSGPPTSLPREGGLAGLFDPLVPEPAELAGVSVETEYAVFPGEPFVHVTTTLANRGATEAPLFAYGEVWMRGGRSGRSFVGNTLDPARSRGFHHESFDRSDILDAGDAFAAFTFVAVTGMRQLPPVAYALFSPERTQRGLRFFGVTGEHVTLANAFLADPEWGEIGLWRLLGATRATLAPGETWSHRRRLLVAPGRDVASATDLLFPALGFADGTSGVEGRCEPASVVCVVHVRGAASGAPVTQIETPTEGPDAGRYRAVLPPGEYALSLRAPQRGEREASVRVAAGDFARVPPQRFPEPGWLVFGEAALADGGPGRVVVQGVEGTPDPVFGPELLGFRIDGRPGRSGTETRDLHFVGNDRDPARVALPPGRYRLTATRGPEWDVAEVEVAVPGPGAEVHVPPLLPRRVVRLPGWIAADLHVHAEASDDSGMSNEARLRSMVAEGVELMVSTDHDHLGSFEAALERLAVRDRIAVVGGGEVTNSAPHEAAPFTVGHHNAWPIAYRPHAHRKGAPPSGGLAPADLYTVLRRDYGARVVQLNHPRVSDPEGRDEEALFTHLGSAGEAFDPTRPLEAHPNELLLRTGADGTTRAIDFDTIEVMNGIGHERYRQVRADWNALLRQGVRRTAVANSDTHGPDSPAGIPRTYVRAEGARGEAGRAAFDAALAAGRAFGTNGPLITRFQVNGGDIGDTVRAPDGHAHVEIQVVAAPFVPVDEVRLLANGEVVRRWTQLPVDSDLRLGARTTVPLAGDAFLTLEAGVPLGTDAEAWRAAHPGPYAAAVAPGALPQAFTNPIFVDADGDGRFEPPGLPPKSLRPPGGWRLVGLVALVAAALAIGWGLRRRTPPPGAS